MKKRAKKVLVGPLDWGLGHITRTIPIIEKLKERGHDVHTCGNEVAKKLYHEVFPDIPHKMILGYNPKYSSRNTQGWAMVRQSPKFFSVIKKEEKIANDLVEKFNYDTIISDNRYGLKSTKTTNIFICHQTEIMGPKVLKPLLRKINRNYINQFDFCWIPDTNQKINLSGKLSSFTNNSCFKIGPLSRFLNHNSISKQNKYKFTAILSGPEPQRSILESKIIHLFRQLPSKCAIIQGKPLSKNHKEQNIDFFAHLNTDKFLDTIHNSEIILCRSGYSNIMDFSALEKKVIFIPTPGQTEQEYLAKYHSKISNVTSIRQHEISLEKINSNTNTVIQPMYDEGLINLAFEKAKL